MSYSADIFDNSESVDVTDVPVVAQIVGQMYRIGAILEEAQNLRVKRDSGEALTDKQTRLVALTDRMLEVGISQFAEEGLPT